MVALALAWNGRHTGALMNDENLDHLIPRKAELHEVSPWASVRLRLIREDLAPFLKQGVPIKHLLKLLAPLEITCRRETLRKFIRDEFPDEYARYYAKRVTVERMQRQPDSRNNATAASSVETEAQPLPGRDKEQQSVVAPKEKTAHERKTKQLDVDSMLTQVGDFASGKQFDE